MIALPYEAFVDSHSLVGILDNIGLTLADRKGRTFHA